ncbi:MAG: galactose mutarotase [Ruminococcaceae bacterium]|nr:galactose mutarotase [Oscillospiraceae bacterium]
MEKRVFGYMPDGMPIWEYVLKSDSITAAVITYGAILRVLEVKGLDIIGGYDTLDEFLADDDPFQGAIIGRVCNRTKEGRFSLNGKDYQLTINNGRHHLHGGTGGFFSRVWTVDEADDTHVTLSRTSPDGEEGYPANLFVKVTYALCGDCMRITYDAVADGDTPINLTNHAFYNLSGTGAGTVFDHTAWIAADRYTAIDGENIPTGETPCVSGTPFDFRTEKRIGRDLSEALKSYDHNFIFADAPIEEICGLSLPHVATFKGKAVTMDVYTTSPCAQLYTGAFLSGPLSFKGGRPKQKYGAFCFETQLPPDGIHHGVAPLRAGEHFRATTVYRYHYIPS